MVRREESGVHGVGGGGVKFEQERILGHEDHGERMIRGLAERTQGFTADPDYWKGEVFAYVGLPQNLKDLWGAAFTVWCVGGNTRV